MLIKVLILFSVATIISIQSISKPRRELQIGISHNNIKFKIYTPNIQSATTTILKNTLFPQPNFRYTYHFTIYKKDTFPKLLLSTFIGYGILGGKSKSDTSSYKDKIAFHAFEIGIYPSFYFNKNLSVALAFKTNYLPLVINKQFGTVYQSDSIPRKWTSENVAKYYKDVSINLGFSCRYKINRLFTLSGEYWTSLSNLSNMKSDIVKVRTKEHNYILLIGYNF